MRTFNVFTGDKLELTLTYVDRNLAGATHMLRIESEVFYTDARTNRLEDAKREVARYGKQIYNWDTPVEVKEIAP